MLMKMTPFSMSASGTHGFRVYCTTACRGFTVLFALCEKKKLFVVFDEKLDPFMEEIDKTSGIHGINAQKRTIWGKRANVYIGKNIFQNVPFYPVFLGYIQKPRPTADTGEVEEDVYPLRGNTGDTHSGPEAVPLCG
jgi:hypothetical protein